MTTLSLPPRTWSLIEDSSPAGYAHLADHSVHTAFTSPPYFAKVDYDPGAPDWAQLGQEDQPEQYIQNLADCLDPLRRVLRKDGALWVNIGDTRAGSGGAGGDHNPGGIRAGQPGYEGSGKKARRGAAKPDPRLGHGRLEGGVSGRRGHGAGSYLEHKPKDLIGIPFLLAQEMKRRGWWWRDDIIWAKPNPKPEGPRDRTVNTHEYVWLFTPSARTWFDHYAVQEPAVPKVITRRGQRPIKLMFPKRFRRSVWTMPVSTYKGAHFATFPESLPALGIEATTPEIGVCGTCGAPPSRITERDQVTKQLRHLRWELPDCGHDWDPVGALVLDPFNGSGTTGIAALRRGRSYVGVEPVAANAVLTTERIQAELPLLARARV